MSAIASGVVMVCDTCGFRQTMRSTTVKGARGDAHRIGWAVSVTYRPEKASADKSLPDECPTCSRARRRSEGDA